MLSYEELQRGGAYKVWEMRQKDFGGSQVDTASK
jgi:hypothetical protein